MPNQLIAISPNLFPISGGMQSVRRGILLIKLTKLQAFEQNSPKMLIDYRHNLSTQIYMRKLLPALELIGAVETFRRPLKF